MSHGKMEKKVNFNALGMTLYCSRKGIPIMFGP